jgi:hypothetical protein
MKTLTLVGTAHIQAYIFERTNRLRESVGASLLVGDLFKEWKKWPQERRIFIGGGNAALLFDSPTEAVVEIRRWSEEVLRRAPGLRVVAAHVKYREGTLPKAYQEAVEELEERSEVPPFGSPLGALPVVRTCPSTALACDTYDDDEHRRMWVNRESYAKWHQAREQERSGTQEFPYDLADIGIREGASLVAVVHADGDGVGEELRNLIQDTYTSDQMFKDRLGKYSEALTWLNSEARCKLFDDVRAIKETLVDEKVISDSEFLPLRPIIGAGDDLTFITHGRLGLALAARYLRHYRDLSPAATRKYQSAKGYLTSSAGVLIMPLKFPFARGYQIAEQLTASAKRARRRHGEDGSWLDFHLLLEGSSGSLQALRRRYGVLPSCRRTGSGRTTSEPGRRLQRPYQVDTQEVETQASWARFENLWSKFNEWPRSAAKELFQALWSGPTVTRSLVERFDGRNRRLPDPGPAFPVAAVTGWQAESTPYFDPLEVLDHHVQIDWDRKVVIRPVRVGRGRR